MIIIIINIIIIIILLLDLIDSTNIRVYVPNAFLLILHNRLKVIIIMNNNDGTNNFVLK